jgi:putative transposase
VVSEGDVIDFLFQPCRDRCAAAHRTIMPSVAHDTTQYANNRAEVSREPTRQRERGMRRFKSMAQAQRFLSVHGITQILFRVGRHLLRAGAFVVWNAVTCA